MITVISSSKDPILAFTVFHRHNFVKFNSHGILTKTVQYEIQSCERTTYLLFCKLRYSFFSLSCGKLILTRLTRKCVLLFTTSIRSLRTSIADCRRRILKMKSQQQNNTPENMKKILWYYPHLPAFSDFDDTFFPWEKFPSAPQKCLEQIHLTTSEPQYLET